MSALRRLLQHPITVRAPTRRTRQAYRVLLVAWVTLNAADLLTTTLLLPSPRGHEANQVAAAVYAHGGLPALGMYKFAATAVGVYLARSGYPWLGRLMVWALVLVNGVLLLAVLNNLTGLAG